MRPVPDVLEIRCPRCATMMELRDPAPGAVWAAVQFWVCPSCSRHIWTTYPPPKTDKPADKAEPAPVSP
jgi:hypothetical protein